MTSTALETARSLLGVVLVSLLVPAAMSAQASATMKVSATVVASQTVAPQASAAALAESVVERMQVGEQMTVEGMDRTDVDDSGVTLSLDVVEQADLMAPAVEQAVSEEQMVQVTVAFSGN